ncbi:MAG: hypothetical protein LUH58_01670, partial [Lachnospiraceae bacterium]|nr:hypothetical protein [Lachnospiraceae bacterium]
KVKKLKTIAEMEVNYMASSWWLEEEKERAYQEGEAKGRMRKVVDLCCRKLAKGKSAAEIADDLECDLSQISEILEVVQKYAPDYDIDKILEELCREPLL